VAQKALQGVGIASISEVDGESVAEAVDVGVGDASTPPKADNEMAEGISGERSASLGDEQRVVGAVVGAGGQVAPDGPGSGGVYVDGALFGSLLKSQQTIRVVCNCLQYA
jgi:hypothetical protein